MVSWKYQIIKHDLDPDNVWFGLHTVFYNDAGMFSANSAHPIVIGNTLDELLSDLKMMSDDATKNDTLTESELQVNVSSI